MKEVRFRNFFFFFFFFCVTYSRVFLKNAAIGPSDEHAYLGSFRIIGCLTYGRVFKKRGYRSPLSDMKLQIFCVCNL